MADAANFRADADAAGQALLLSLMPVGDRTASRRVTGGHQAVVRERLQQAPAEVVAATLHDSDDDLAAYAVRVRGGLIVVSEGESSAMTQSSRWSLAGRPDAPRDSSHG